MLTNCSSRSSGIAVAMYDSSFRVLVVCMSVVSVLCCGICVLAINCGLLTVSYGTHVSQSTFVLAI
jgi:hypothetical protein